LLHDPAPESRTGLRAYIIISAVAFLVVGVYIGWIFYSRWESNRALLEKSAEKQRSQNQKTYEMMGGDRFEILSYVANPAIIKAGEQSSLCYSVSNAKALKIEPKTDEPVWPAFGRCVHVSPRHTTKYILTIEDGAGQAKTASAEVQVR
jgi:hypothetical protein